MQVAATGASSIVDMIEAEALCDELAAKWIVSVNAFIHLTHSEQNQKYFRMPIHPFSSTIILGPIFPPALLWPLSCPVSP